jgi:hypothetical protein
VPPRGERSCSPPGCRSSRSASTPSALTPTAGEQRKLTQITDLVQAAVRNARQHPTVLSPASHAPFDRVDSLVTAFGIPACAVGG